MSQRRGEYCYLVAKRALDLVGATVGLMALAVLFLPIALAVYLDSRGPIFFRQRRVGKGGRLFTVTKFRTMRTQAAADSEQGGEEARVTQVGRWLRRTGMDELPQFLNVLKGEMSLVGPRPELPELFAAYAPWQRRRIEVAPGLTGWWQIHGRPQPMSAYIHYDIYYVTHRSLGFDLRILLLTIPSLLRHQGCLPDADGEPAPPEKTLAAVRHWREG